MTKEQICPCGSHLKYKNCCQPFHEGGWPEHAEQLMRSRFSAYVLHLPNYIMKTTHPKNPDYHKNHEQWKILIDDFSSKTQFKKLHILSSHEEKNHAFVIFVVYLFQENVDITFTEKSFFEKVEGHWFYRKGEIVLGVVPESYFFKKTLPD